MSKWSEMMAKRRFERLQEAIDKGFIEADEVEPDYIEIPEEPDRKWTDKPMEKPR
jgi:hypothetical protein